MEHDSLNKLHVQNVSLIVKPALTVISAQSVKLGFTYILESALKTARNGWNPTITQWSAMKLCIVKLVNGARGALAQRKGKHAVSKEGMKQGSEKSYNFLLQRGAHAHIQVRQENVLYKEKDARKEKKMCAG
uniref:Uncharacterized protein n=1 Tax=Sphaerodactylus townsendi TaxID=933632 RepID=A0ACB8GDI4_9SAUR